MASGDCQQRAPSTDKLTVLDVQDTWRVCKTLSGLKGLGMADDSQKQQAPRYTYLLPCTDDRLTITGSPQARSVSEAHSGLRGKRNTGMTGDGH